MQPGEAPLVCLVDLQLKAQLLQRATAGGNFTASSPPSVAGHQQLPAGGAAGSPGHLPNTQVLAVGLTPWHSCSLLPPRLGRSQQRPLPAQEAGHPQWCCWGRLHNSGASSSLLSWAILVCFGHDAIHGSSLRASCPPLPFPYSFLRRLPCGPAPQLLLPWPPLQPGGHNRAQSLLWLRARIRPALQRSLHSQVAALGHYSLLGWEWGDESPCDPCTRA